MYGITTKMIIIGKNVNQPLEVKKVLFDEQSVIELCEIRGETVILNEKSPYNFIETITVMNKYLLNRTVPSSTAKYSFAGIDLSQYENLRSGLSLRVTHNLQNMLINSAIYHGDHRIGTLQFAAVMP